MYAYRFYTEPICVHIIRLPVRGLIKLSLPQVTTLNSQYTRIESKTLDTRVRIQNAVNNIMGGPKKWVFSLYKHNLT